MTHTGKQLGTQTNRIQPVKRGNAEQSTGGTAGERDGTPEHRPQEAARGETGEPES